MEFIQRKHTRLKEYNYNSAGAYFVTICTQNRQCILSYVVGRGLAPAVIQLTEYGKIAEEQLLLIEKRYPSITVDRYVIMPNHIHIIFLLRNSAAGASPRPTIMDVVCTYKSLTTRICKQHNPIDKLFQTSFHEHIIRNKYDYDDISKYICENPLRWQYDKLHPRSMGKT